MREGTLTDHQPTNRLRPFPAVAAAQQLSTGATWYTDDPSSIREPVTADPDTACPNVVTIGCSTSSQVELSQAITKRCEAT